MRKQVHFIVMYEGKRDLSFIKAYLKQKGFSVRNIVPRPCATDLGGSGEACVRNQFFANVMDVRNYAARNGSSNRWLIVHSDADTKTREHRCNMLHSQLPQNAKLNNDDPICILIPKRHTETWVYHILHPTESVTETDVYKNSVSDDEVKDAGKQLAYSDPTSSSNCPSSLKVGYSELCRLPK